MTSKAEQFFTADYHLFHENIIEYCNRPWKKVDEMHKQLIFRHNSVVNSHDIVWNLGDVTLDDAQYVFRNSNAIKKFNGTKHLVVGNHDEWKYTSYENIGFLTVHTAMWFEYGGFTFYMMHDPSKYTAIENNPKAIMLCGHIHKLFKHLLPEKRIINVGIDVWDYTPVNLKQILELLSEHKINIQLEV